MALEAPEIENFTILKTWQSENLNTYFFFFLLINHFTNYPVLTYISLNNFQCANTALHAYNQRTLVTFPHALALVTSLFICECIVVWLYKKLPMLDG